MSSEKDYSVLPEVTIIQESAKIESEEHKPKKLRVCAYARVSTEKEEQEYSFENQRDYYMDYISKRSDWEFVGIYSDFGLSGKNKKRPQFIKMIDDCHAGKIDRIITKSISRFARNTIDCIQTVRDLREKGIGVYFEREGIDSLSPQSALVLSIMAIVAEEESRSISNNIKWAIQKQFAQGHYWASDRKTARAEVKKHGANNNLLTFFAYDDATASFPTLSKERNLLRILDGVHFGFLDILLKIENGQTLSRGETILIQKIREEEPDCLAYESEIDRTKTNYIFFEKGFKKLAIRELRLRLGSEEKISKNMIWCAGTCDYTAYLESYGEFFLPKARLGRDPNYTNSEEYKSRKAINNYWYGVYNDSIKRKPHIEISVNPKTGEVNMSDKPGMDE